jgi:hypothetical protein
MLPKDCVHHVKFEVLTVEIMKITIFWVVRPCNLAYIYQAILLSNKQTTNKLHGLSPRAKYTDRVTAACRRNDCQLLRIKGATWSA